MRGRVLHAVALAAILVFVGYACILIIGVPHSDPLPAARIRAKMARQIQVKEVAKIMILLDEPLGQMLVLERGRDDRDIEILLGSIKRLRVPERENRVNETDRIGVSKLKPHSGGMIITGRFDPARAPVVSRTLLSEDLGTVVYDIFRRRGIEPRSR